VPGVFCYCGAMKVYLDDERQTPEGWERTYTAGATIELLTTGRVTELSLDHDLGLDPRFGNGYDVLGWIEEQVILNGFVPPKIHVHSANPSARVKMFLAVRSIEAWAEKNRERGLEQPSDAS